MVHDKKSLFQRIIGGNLLLVLGLAGGLRLLIRSEYTRDISGYGVVMALGVVSLTLLNLVGALLTRNSVRRRAYLLGALVVLLIGFGACAAGVRSMPRTERIY